MSINAQENILHEEIERCYEEGILGTNVLGSGLTFDLELFVSPGGYICGEESALIEAIEGKRAEPRNKPPFPVAQGVFNKPTALNNVETFANVPQILTKGVDWYKAQGQGGAAGLKFVGISGDVRNPGVFEIPMGLPMSEVIFNLAGGIIGRKTVEGVCTVGAIVGIFACVEGGCAAGFQVAGRDWIHARIGRYCGLRRRPMYARHGLERGEIFPQ